MKDSCKNDAKSCRSKSEIISYAYNLSKEFVKKIDQRAFYLNDVQVVLEKTEHSRFLLSLVSTKDQFEVAFLYK